MLYKFMASDPTFNAVDGTGTLTCVCCFAVDVDDVRG
jgi:hypothetical protein